MTESDTVYEFEAGTCGDAGGEAGDFQAEGGEFFGEVDGGGFSAGIGAEAENDFADLIGFSPSEESGNFKFIGADAVEGGEESAEDMVATPERGGAFEAEDIGGVFDDAKKGLVAGVIATDFAETVFGKEVAGGAGENEGAGLADGVSEIFGGAWGCGEKVEGEAFGGAWTEAWKFSQGGDEPEGGGRVISHPILCWRSGGLIDDAGVELFEGGADGGIVEESFFGRRGRGGGWGGRFLGSGFCGGGGWGGGGSGGWGWSGAGGSGFGASLGAWDGEFFEDGF